MKTIDLGIISFNGNLDFKELPLFRGAIMSLAQNSNYFSNHSDNNSFIYRYPLVQYKIINNEPTIIGWGEAVNPLDNLFVLRDSYILRIGRQEREFQVIHKNFCTIEPPVELPDYKKFRIYNWLPLNQDNYNIFKNEISLANKTSFLDNILTANILSLYKGLGLRFTFPVKAFVSDITHCSTIDYKGVNMEAFDVIISSNVSLPCLLGLGKGVSRGFGIINNYIKNKNQ